MTYKSKILTPMQLLKRPEYPDGFETEISTTETRPVGRHPQAHVGSQPDAKLLDALSRNE
jgi:hypothetical protein